MYVFNFPALDGAGEPTTPVFRVSAKKGLFACFNKSLFAESPLSVLHAILISIMVIGLMLFADIEIAGCSQLKEFQKESEAIKESIDKSNLKIKKIKKKEADILTGLNDIELVMNETRRTILKNQSELSTLEKQISANSDQYRKMNKKIRENEIYSSKRLVALYKLNWLGRMSIIAAADSVPEMIHRKSALEKILSYDERHRHQLIQDKARLNQIITTLSQRKTEKVSLESAQKKQLAILAGKKIKRSQMLAAVRKEESIELEALKALKEAARKLDGKMASFKSQKQVKIENKIISPLKPFNAYKGLLRMPVQGKIISYFGPYTDTRFNVKNFQRGIDIQAERGTPVHSVSAGTVIYSSWFKGYGNMMVIDHGNSYYTVYAHMEEVYKVKGDTVETGERIATVGDTGSLSGPKLHFEVRHHGKALNPLEWLKS
jgi:septal ring factor EnvC (AmiA/AmiB activator)